MDKSLLHKKLNNAVKILKRGGIIIIPTETVYGIAVDATNNSAINKIYKIKNRTDAKPLQIMCGSLKMAEEIAVFDEISKKFCEENWPGALTAIVQMKNESSISKNFNNVDNSIGIRVPNHNLVLELIKLFDSPLAVSSANISGQWNPLNTDSISREVINSADYVIDGGTCLLGKPSTVVDFRTSPPHILRQGNVKLSI